MKHKTGHILSCLLILSFVTMGISPACEFISGDEQYIEICTDDNEVERITLAEAGLASKRSSSHHSAEKTECMFCFSGSHTKALKTVKSETQLPPLTAYLRNGGGMYVPKSLDNSPFDARGPPSTVV